MSETPGAAATTVAMAQSIHRLYAAATGRPAPVPLDLNCDVDHAVGLAQACRHRGARADSTLGIVAAESAQHAHAVDAIAARLVDAGQVRIAMDLRALAGRVRSTGDVALAMSRGHHD